jgi:hypothetical protein
VFHQRALTAIGSDVSLVSVIVKAPPLTAKGSAVSEGSSAYSVNSWLVVTLNVMLGGGLGGGEFDGGMELIPDVEWSCPQPASSTTAAPTQMGMIFMTSPDQSFALVGEPANGLLR